MQFGWTSIAGSLTLLYAGVKLVSLIRFYILARRTGFPLYISPVPSKSPVWMVLGPALQPQFKRYLPSWIFERLDIVTHGWEFRRKGEFHRRLGKVFIVVTPDENAMYIADPAIGNLIMQKRKEFVQAPIAGRILGIFGSNIFQANGDDWTRQRRIVAPNLNERISETTWDETCRQARMMIEYLVKHPGGQTLSGLRCIAINVIGAAGYGQKEPWVPEFENFNQGWDGGRGSYFKTIALVADAILEAVFMPSRLLQLSIMPSNLQLLGKHKEQMPKYMKRVLDEERRAIKDGSTVRHNFLSMLVRFSDEEKEFGLSLTDDEISGNLFVFSTAGFDTTANTMGYAVMLLAVYPEWQRWVREGLQKLDPDVTTWRYEEIFPKCVRMLALMFETLRLYTPVAHVTRHIADSQQIADENTTHILAPPMDVYVSSQIMHVDSGIWGPDSMEFRPTRWIDAHDQIVMPPKGTFLPWAGGPRVCPGMKMAQVEFVAALSTLFRLSRCEILLEDNEDFESAKRRLLDMIDASTPKLTLQVKDPKQVKLRWVSDPILGQEA